MKNIVESCVCKGAKVNPSVKGDIRASSLCLQEIIPNAF